MGRKSLSIKNLQYVHVLVSISLLLGLLFYIGTTNTITPHVSIAVSWKELQRGLNKEVEPYKVCEVPQSRFKAWNEGVVTVLEPMIERDCNRVFAGNTEETDRIQAENRYWKNALTDKDLLQRTTNCSWVVDYFQDNMYITKLERSFPMAYTFVIYDSPQQSLRLLRFLYRSTNTYCIHPDRKSSPVLLEIFVNIATCLKNVIIPSQLESVNYYENDATILNAQMNCLTELVQMRFSQPENKKWKYVINLCGKELPLASTHGIASRLQKLNGSSAIRAFRSQDRESLWRVKNKELPFNLPLYKSMTYAALSYQFAHYLLTNFTAIKVHQFFRRCLVPEEHYYPTLYMIPGAPGGYNPTLPKQPYLQIASSFWLNHGSSRKCHGEKVHRVCIVNSADFKAILRASNEGRHVFFHNKYFMEKDHTIMDCAEERIVKMNKKEFAEDCG